MKLWDDYSKKMAQKIDRPRNAGHFSDEEAKERQMRYVVGHEGLAADGNSVALYWLVDETDGIIVDAKFQLFGQSALIAAADAACDLLIGKNYDQARRMSADLIDKQLRDDPEEPAFPADTLPHLNLVIDAIDAAVEKCSDLPLPESYTTPVPRDQASSERGGYPGFLSLDRAKKLAVIEEIIEEEIRPYIELDAGGIEVTDFIEEREIVISYKGACTSCFSSIGTTLDDPADHPSESASFAYSDSKYGQLAALAGCAAQPQRSESIEPRIV